MEQYRTQLYSLMERIRFAATGKAPAEHKRHKDALPIVVISQGNFLKVRWLKSLQLWRVVYVRGIAADMLGVTVTSPTNLRISDARAVEIAEAIIRAAVKQP